MDILIDGVIFGLQKAGGISRVWADLLLALNASSYDVGLLIPTNQNIEWRAIESNLSRIKIFKRRRFRWGKSTERLDSAYLTSLYARWRPTIWHSSYYVGLPYFAKHRLVSYHDMIPEKTGQVVHYDQQRKYLSLKRASLLLAPSQSAHDDLMDYWPELGRKVAVVPHGLSALPVESISAPSPYFVFVGKREGYKSFLPAIQAILADPLWNAYSILAIGGEEQKTLIHPRIRYLKTLPYPQVLGYIQKASALLFPSQYEGFGLPVLEAFALGTPVLASKTSSIPEITGPAYPLVSGNNYSEILKQLINNQGHWIEYGHQRARLFSTEACWKGYQTIYGRWL